MIVNPGRCPGLKYCALSGRFFDYLITGDNDLLVLKEFGKAKIVTLTEFAAVFS